MPGVPVYQRDRRNIRQGLIAMARWIIHPVSEHAVLAVLGR